MATLYTWKVTGRLTTSVDGTATDLLATKTVEYHSDGTLRFTDASGVKRVINVGRDEGLAHLINELFTGTGGWATGQKPFGA